jgi:hypothetical protein
MRHQDCIWIVALLSLNAWAATPLAAGQSDSQSPDDSAPTMVSIASFVPPGQSITPMADQGTDPP